MDRARAHDPKILAHYEGLIFRTAQLLLEPTKHGPPVQMEREDIEQVLRIKVFQALVAYDPAKSRLDQDRYVFMCVTSQSIDLRNRRKRLTEDYIEDVACTGDEEMRDWFDARYLSTSHDQVYGQVEDDDLLIPSTLDDAERAIVVGLYGGWKQTEIAERLGLEKREIEKAMRSIRAKMADWNPGLGSLQLELAAA